MFNHVKALVIIWALAAGIFYLAKPLCLKYMAEEDFLRRRNVWFALSAFAFLSPNFWYYALAAAPVAFWAGRKDPNPAALYALLLFVAPAAGVFIPKLIQFSPVLLLTVTVAIPALLRAKASGQAGVTGASHSSGTGLPTFLLFAFCTIQALLYWRYESVTSVMRRELTLVLNTFVPFLLFSRTLRSRDAIREAMACFSLACAIMVPLAVFESVRGWQLYADKSMSWGAQVNPAAFLMRAGQLRAMVATGHSLELGYVFAICFCFCLYLQRAASTKWQHTATVGLAWAGLLASYSRAAWLTALLMMLVYLWLHPGGMRRVFKVAFFFCIAALALYPTRFGQRIIDSLPFIGTVDSGNTEYRQRLLTRSLELIPDHPWFGDLLVRQRMQDLIQGQGIVDLVNGYLMIALQYGLVTLAVVMIFIFLAIGRTLITAFRLRKVQPDDAMLGLNLAACLLGTLLFVAGATFYSPIWTLSGFCVAYACVVDRAPSGRRIGGVR